MKAYTPPAADVRHWFKSSLDHYNISAPDKQETIVKQLKENVSVWEFQLKKKGNDCFYEAFPIGECNRELKTKLVAAKKLLKAIK